MLLFPELFELLSGLFALETLADDSGLDAPLEEQASGIEALSDPETGDVEGAEEDDASPVTETFLLNLSITADKEPLVLFGVVEPAIELPVFAVVGREVQFELAEACCFTLGEGDEEMEDEADVPEGNTKVEDILFAGTKIYHLERKISEIHFK